MILLPSAAAGIGGEFLGRFGGCYFGFRFDYFDHFFTLRDAPATSLAGKKMQIERDFSQFLLGRWRVSEIG